MKTIILIICLLGAFSVISQAPCTDCFGETSGVCQAANKVCYPEQIPGSCFPDTVHCGGSTKYSCDQSSYTCAEDASGTYDSQTACDDACVAPVTKYGCDSSSYTCSASTGGSYDSQASCDAACVAPANKYTCNSGSHSCSVSTNGNYDTQSACENACQEAPVYYNCDASTYTCSQNPTGTYNSQSDCENSCVEAPTKYSCSGTTCSEDANGNYDSMSACTSACSGSGGDSKKGTITCKSASGVTSTETFDCYDNAWGLEASTTAWELAGAPKSKLAAGLAFYSRIFGKTQNDQISSGLFDQCSWCYSLPSIPAVLQYFSIKSALIDTNQRMNNWDWEICRDDIQQSPWAYSSDACSGSGCDNSAKPGSPAMPNFISYDDPESIKAKTQWAIDNDLGALIIWELYGDTCDNELLNAIHEVYEKNTHKPKITAYYGNWRIYGSYKYYPYISASDAAGMTCSDSWSISQPVTGQRNWGITDDVASKIDTLNIGFATVSFSNTGYYYPVSPDANADYQTTGLPTGSGCLNMPQNTLCLVPYIGAYEASQCASSAENSQGYVSYS